MTDLSVFVVFYLSWRVSHWTPELHLLNLWVHQLPRLHRHDSDAKGASLILQDSLDAEPQPFDLLVLVDMSGALLPP